MDLDLAAPYLYVIPVIHREDKSLLVPPVNLLLTLIEAFTDLSLPPILSLLGERHLVGRLCVS